MLTNPHLFDWPTKEEWREEGPRLAVGLAAWWCLTGPFFVPYYLYNSAEDFTRTLWRKHCSEEGKASKGRKRIEKQAEKVYQGQRNETKPQHLRYGRRRALTSCSIFSGGEKEELETESIYSKRDSHISCLLLTKLPLKVRTSIWRMVVGGHMVAIFRGKGRLLHVLQDEEGIEEPEYGSGMPDFYSTPSRRHLSALLKTCRQVYVESVDLLYTQNTFSIWQNDTIFDLQSTTLPHRFNAIRSLRLHWQFRFSLTFERDARGDLLSTTSAPWDVESWENACKAFKNMEGLEDLFVIIRGPFLINLNVVDMLQSLRGVEIEKDKFKVRVPWPFVIARTKNDAVDRRFEDKGFPFHVFRPKDVLMDYFSGLEFVEHAFHDDLRKHRVDVCYPRCLENRARGPR